MTSRPPLGALAWTLACLAVTLTAALTPLIGPAPPASAAEAPFDEAYGDGGSAYLDASLTDEQAVGVALTPDGTVVVGDSGPGPEQGAGLPPAPRAALLARFGEDGRHDPRWPARLPDRDDEQGFEVQATLTAPDGGLFLGGVNGWHGPEVRRIHPTGRLDESFGIGGRLQIRGERVHGGVVLAMAFQPDGRIVVAGRSSYSSDNELLVARLNPNGTMDETFGARGATVLDYFDDFPIDEDTIGFGVGVQPSGGIVVVGVTVSEYGLATVLARLTPSGRHDLGFGDEGWALGPLGEFFELPNALVTLPGGNFLVAGVRVYEEGTDAFVRRHLPDGKEDLRFAGGGAILGRPGRDEGAFAMAVDGENRVVVTGVAVEGDGDLDTMVARLGPDGRVDPAFAGGRGGVPNLATFDAAGRGEDDQAAAITVDPAGRILVAGTTWDAQGGDLFLLRLDPTGEPDPALGPSGFVSADAGIGHEDRPGMAVLPDGSVVTAGSAHHRRAGPAWSDAVVTRQGPSGAADPAFGRHGLAHPAGDEYLSQYRAVATGADGSVAAVGHVGARLHHSDFLVSRFLPDGSPDPGFGDGGSGSVIVDLGSAEPEYYGIQESFTSVLVQSDGKIVAAGIDQATHALLLARFGLDGTLDPGFGTGGVATAQPQQPTGEWDIALAPDGSIVAAATEQYASLYVRFRPDGTLDGGFGEGGMTRISDDQGQGGFAMTVQGVTVGPDGTVIGVGTKQLMEGNQVLAVRLTPTGELDPTFDCDGLVLLNLGEHLSLDVRGVALDGHGRVVVAGTTAPAQDDGTGRREIVVARLDTGGRPDPGFGTEGMARTTPAGTYTLVAGVGMDGAGAPIVAGEIVRPSGSVDGFTMRYDPGGPPAEDDPAGRALDCVVSSGPLPITPAVGTAVEEPAPTAGVGDAGLEAPASTPSGSGGGKHDLQAPPGVHRPDPFEQREPHVAVDTGQDGEDGRPDGVHQQIGRRIGGQPALL